MRRFPAILTFIVAFAASCTNRENANKFNDPIVRQIYDLIDRRATDSLILFADHPDARYRAEAALGFATVQDSAAAEVLGALALNDPSVDVRVNAAYALGQCKGLAPAKFLLSTLEKEKSDAVIREVLEALGKQVLATDMSEFLAYRPTTTPQAEGFVWGLYRIGIRGLADSTVAKKASHYLHLEHAFALRLGAAHFFARSRNLDIQPHASILRVAAASDPEPEVRMASVIALRRLNFDLVHDLLDSIVKTDPDSRVRVNAMRAASSGDYDVSRSTLQLGLLDSSLSVQIAASEQIRSAQSQEGFFNLDTLLIRPNNYRVRANLIAAYLKQVARDEALGRISLIKLDQFLNRTQSTYEKAAMISALSEVPLAYSQLVPHLQSETPILRTSAMGALAAINRHPLFREEWSKEFIPIYKNAVLGSDPFVCAIAASILQNPELGYKSLLPNYSFIKEALDKLVLPRDVEAVEPLKSALAYFEGGNAGEPATSPYNHPIDWNLVQQIPDNLEAQVLTSKGQIAIRLLVDESPGSVANFVALVERGYYNGLFFHRVVSNFVIQTGCYRGDGYGSEDYSIRSELGRRRYATGSVGMASAGKDTEGTQWFITHSPTPHLEGAYSIFAETVGGQEVVDRIEVGDQIIEVTFGKRRFSATQ